jgi:hypothetical protein
MTELPLKQFCYEQAEREQVTPLAIYHRFHRGRYPGVAARRVGRSVFIVITFLSGKFRVLITRRPKNIYGAATALFKAIDLARKRRNGK